MLRLFFMNPVRYGGHVTFTAHLMRGLRQLDVPVELYKLHHRSERFFRSFGYDEIIRNVSIEEAAEFAKNDPILITAPSKPNSEQIDQLLQLGARIVIHDPAEFKHGWDLDLAQYNKPIVIRKTMEALVANSTFILHPYDPYHPPALPLERRKKFAISTSRIDFDKHTNLILDANRLLPKTMKVDIRGFENRIYTRFNILPKYPEWVQSVRAYDRELRAAVHMMEPVRLNVDMSVIKQDGGGTQYTFLEAADAGCCCVVNKQWILPKGLMQPGVNCVAAESGEELAGIIRMVKEDPTPYQRFADTFQKYMLEKHDAKSIAKRYKKVLAL